MAGHSQWQEIEILKQKNSQMTVENILKALLEFEVFHLALTQLTVIKKAIKVQPTHPYIWQKI